MRVDRGSWRTAPAIPGRWTKRAGGAAGAVARVTGALLLVALVATLLAAMPWPAVCWRVEAAATGNATIVLVARSYSFIWVVNPEITLTPTQADMERDWVAAEGESGIHLWALTLDREGMTLFVKGEPGSPPGISRDQVAVKSSTAGSLVRDYQPLTGDVPLWRCNKWGIYPVTVDVKVSNLWQLSEGTWQFTLVFIAASN
ncbi:MAG TPA: hypothetical protein GXX55_11295 [Firmicutes bacterium]|nr:hypothetical protein [Bacillota bacterium]